MCQSVGARWTCRLTESFARYADRSGSAVRTIDRDRAGEHPRRKLWLGRKADIGGHVCSFQAIRVVSPFLRKIQRTIDERMTVARNVGREDADLAVRDLAGGTSILPRGTLFRVRHGSRTHAPWQATP